MPGSPGRGERAAAVNDTGRAPERQAGRRGARGGRGAHRGREARFGRDLVEEQARGGHGDRAPEVPERDRVQRARQARQRAAQLRQRRRQAGRRARVLPGAAPKASTITPAC